MGRLADLRAKCSNGVGPTCTDSEFAEFQNLSHENSAASWFDRIMGGVSSISGIILGATGNQQQQQQYYQQQPPPKQTSPLLWIGIVVAAVIILIVVLALVRRKPATK